VKPRKLQARAVGVRIRDACFVARIYTDLADLNQQATNAYQEEIDTFPSGQKISPQLGVDARAHWRGRV